MIEDQEKKEAVLAANEAFYSAFAGADLDAIDALWGHSGPVAVEHPGTRRILGRVNVIDSWRLILRAPPKITSHVEDIIKDEDQWAVICQEDLGQAVIRMVNVFQEEADGWKMVYHGPAPERVLSS